MNKFLSLTLLFSILTSCTTAGVFSERKIYTGYDTWNLKGINILEALETVSKEKNYNIEEKSATKLYVGKKSNGFENVGYGKVAQARIWFITKDDFQTVKIKIIVTGNYGFGTKENADKII